LLSHLASAVLTSNNPLFAQLIPHVLKRNSVQWMTAYTLVFQYLKEHRLTITFGTTTTENSAILPSDGQTSSTSDEQLSDLVDRAHPKQTLYQKLQRPPPLEVPAIETPKQ
jgi:hypothetical protein